MQVCHFAELLTCCSADVPASQSGTEKALLQMSREGMVWRRLSRLEPHVVEENVVYRCSASEKSSVQNVPRCLKSIFLGVCKEKQYRLVTVGNVEILSLKPPFYSGKRYWRSQCAGKNCWNCSHVYTVCEVRESVCCEPEYWRY